MSLYEIIDEARRCVNMIRVKFSDRHDVLGLRDDEFRCGSGCLVEIVLGHPIHEVSRRIRLPRANQSDVGCQGRLEDMFLPVDDSEFPSLRERRTRSGRRIESTQTSAARAYRLGQRTLR